MTTKWMKGKYLQSHVHYAPGLCGTAVQDKIPSITHAVGIGR